MKYQVFEIQGRSFVAGLFWQPLPGTLRDRKRETERLAKELNFDLAVWLATGALQVGLASSALGAKPGWLSASAAVSKALEIGLNARDFLCAAEVPGARWLYVAQRDGVLLADGDLIGTEDEIRARMLQDMSLGDWPTIFAPEHWAIPGAQERTFEHFLPQKGGKRDFKRWWGLAPIKANPLKTFMPLAAAVLLALGGFYGYGRWQQHKAVEKARALAAAQAQSEAANRPVKPEHPWKLAPSATSFLKACLTRFGETSLWPGNWIPQEADCGGGVFRVTWRREPTGWIEHLKAVEPRASLSSDGSMATLVLPLTSSSGEDERIPDEAGRTLAIYDASQKYGFPVTVNVNAPSPAVLPGDKPNQAPPPEWKELAWSVRDAALPPTVIRAALDGPGFRINKIQASFVNRGLINWNMEGSQYVLP